MISIGVHDWFELNGQLWQVLARDPDHPGELVARRTKDQAVERFTISGLLGEPGFVNTTRPDQRSIANLQQLAYASDQEISRAERVARAIDESSDRVTGADRVASIGRHLRDAGITVSDRQIYRYVSAYERHGLPGLLRRQPGPQSPRTSSHIDAVAILEELMNEQVNLSTGTRSRLIKQAQWRASDRGVALPSTRTLYRLLEDLDAGRSTFGPATTRRSKAQRPHRPYQRQTTLRPGERVEIDSTPLDLFVLMPDQTIARPELTYAMDVATRTICGTLLRPKGTTAYDIGALLLARMLTPMTLQPSWQGRLEMARGIFGDTIPTDAEWERLASEAPVIVPESITTDRGMAFRGTTFTAACSRLEISLNVARPHQPTDKPHVEGGFRQIRERFVQFLAGYTGNAITLRGLDPSKDAVWSLEEVQMLLDLWVLSDWQTSPQEGLRLPAAHRVPLSPNQMFEALTAAAPQAGRTLSFEERLALLPVTYRKIQHYGVNFAHLTYDSPDLYPLHGRQAPYKTARRSQWEVRYDPNCNRQKSNTDFEPSLLVQLLLQRCRLKAGVALQFHDETVSNRKLTLAINTLERAVEGSETDASVAESIRTLMKDLGAPGGDVDTTSIIRFTDTIAAARPEAIERGRDITRFNVPAFPDTAYTKWHGDASTYKSDDARARNLGSQISALTVETRRVLLAILDRGTSRGNAIEVQLADLTEALTTEVWRRRDVIRAIEILLNHDIVELRADHPVVHEHLEENGGLFGIDPDWDSYIDVAVRKYRRNDDGASEALAWILDAKGIPFTGNSFESHSGS